MTGASIGTVPAPEIAPVSRNLSSALRSGRYVSVVSELQFSPVAQQQAMRSRCVAGTADAYVLTDEAVRYRPVNRVDDRAVADDGTGYGAASHPAVHADRRIGTDVGVLDDRSAADQSRPVHGRVRSEEHKSELQSRGHIV